MKILIISDLHSQKIALQYLKKFLSLEQFDLVLCAGDIVEKSDSDTNYLDQILSICKKNKVKFLAIPGNNESQKAFEKMVKIGSNIHLNPQKIGKYIFYGIGSWGYDNEFSIKNPKQHQCDQNTIFMSHVPPDIEIIKKIKIKPAVHICGHKHQIALSKIISGVLLIRVPALLTGHAAILDLPSEKVQFITY